MAIVIKLSSGGVAVMRLIGDVDASVEIEKWKAANPGMYVSHHDMADDAIPTDRANREAWVLNEAGDEIVVDMTRIAVPASVPRRKAVKYMRRTEFSPGLSLYDHLIATINAIPDPQMRSDAMDDFLESLYFERNSPQMVGLAALAGISREQLDFHLIEADKLP